MLIQVCAIDMCSGNENVMYPLESRVLPGLPVWCGSPTIQLQVHRETLNATHIPAN